MEVSKSFYDSTNIDYLNKYSESINKGASTDLTKDYAVQNFIAAAKGFDNPEIIENQELSKKIMQLFLDRVLSQVYCNEKKERCIFDIDKLNDESMTPLFEACKVGNKGAAAALIGSGANPIKVNPKSNSLLNMKMEDSVKEAIRQRYGTSRIADYQLGVKFAHKAIHHLLRKYPDYKMNSFMKKCIKTWDLMNFKEGHHIVKMIFENLDGFFSELVKRGVPLKMDDIAVLLDEACQLKDDKAAKSLTKLFMETIQKDPAFKVNAYYGQYGHLYDLAERFDHLDLMKALQEQGAVSVFKEPQGKPTKRKSNDVASNLEKQGDEATKETNSQERAKKQKEKSFIIKLQKTKEGFKIFK